MFVQPSKLLAEPLACRLEAVHMDAQQRMLLEQSWEVLSASTSGHTTAAAVSTAVVVGIGTVDYTSVSAHLGVGIYIATGQSLYDCSIVAPASNRALSRQTREWAELQVAQPRCLPCLRLWGSILHFQFPFF